MIRVAQQIVLWLFISSCSGTRTEAQTVYVTKTGTKYHNSSCRYLKSSFPISLLDAEQKGYTPCGVCKPSKSVDSVNQEKVAPLYSTPKQKNAVSSQCTGTTKAGARCKRRTTNASGLCFQHE
jgi:hypothetical protein